MYVVKTRRVDDEVLLEVIAVDGGALRSVIGWPASATNEGKREKNENTMHYSAST